MQIFFIICWALLVTGNAVAQLSDLRQSRQPLPGVADVSRIGISVELGVAEQQMKADLIVETLRSRFETFGYQVSLDPMALPEGLWLKVDCQAIQEKAASFSRTQAHQLATSTSVQGPPCHLSYFYQQEVIPWKNIDRVIYSESVSTMKKIAEISPPLKPQECVEKFLRLYDVPVLLAAEWGHVDRLLEVLNRKKNPVSRRRLILKLLGETQVIRAYPVLVETLHDDRLAKEAAEALGFFGLKAQRHLLPLLQKRSNPQLQAAAAKGLGRIAAATGNSQQTLLFLKMIEDETLDLRVRTQLVWALGKAPDMRAYPALLELEQDIWNDHSQDPVLQEFRAAVDWSIREVKQGGHGDNF